MLCGGYIIEMKPSLSFFFFIKDKLFYAENIYLDAEKFPPYMPELKYNSVLVFREGDEMVLKLLISGSVQSKSALRKNRSKTAPKSKQGS